MADTQLPGTGQKAQLWISSDDTTGNLFRLKGVVDFEVPQAIRQWEKTTDLDSDAEEYAPGLPDSQELKCTLYYRPGSDTDNFCDSAAADPNPRAIRMFTPVRGVLKAQYDFQGYITYAPGTIKTGAVMQSEVTVRVSGSVAKTNL